MASPKVYIINNTELFHSGSFAVMKYLRDIFNACTVTVAPYVKGLLPEYDFTGYDLVVANGEGNMHDNAQRALSILETLLKAKEVGCKTVLTNTVWQNNNKEMTEMLHGIDYVTVREVKSKQEIQKNIDKEVDVFLDLSYYITIKPSRYNRTYMLTAGNKMGRTKDKPKVKDVGETHTVDIFTQSWEDLVGELQQTNLLVTGRHHEMYAACKARTPFIVMEGNTHKNSGLFETAGVNIPYLPIDASNDDIIKLISEINIYEDEFNRLFDFMEAYEKPSYSTFI